MDYNSKFKEDVRKKNFTFFWCSFSRITDLTEHLHGQEEKSRIERDGLLDRLHELNTENTTVRLENQSLKVCPITTVLSESWNLAFFDLIANHIFLHNYFLVLILLEPVNNNESLIVLVQATLTALEEKLLLSQSEVQQVKVSVKQYESLVDSYKAQVR